MSENAARALGNAQDDDVTIFARRFFREQSQSLLQVAELLDDSFSQAVQLICGRSASTRILLSGVGKAGHIARKTSATLTSLGIPAFFVNPGDTVHGDFGCFCPADILLLFSHSGETSEICRILDYVADTTIKTILITGGAESSAARSAEVVLSYGAVAESGLHGLAPTTSTTLMLVMGDALALTCASRQGFSREDFARNHPGGSLGRSLLRVESVMRTGDRQCVVTGDITAGDAVRLYGSVEGRIGAVTVVDKEGKLLGIFTDGDLRRCITQGTAFLDRPISEVMSTRPITVLTTQTAADAMEVLSARKIDQVVVVDEENRAVGIVDIQDVLRNHIVR